MHLLICDTKGDKREKAKNKAHQHGFSTPTGWTIGRFGFSSGQKPKFEQAHG
jgi:hypothetical protein